MAGVSVFWSTSVEANSQQYVSRFDRQVLDRGCWFDFDFKLCFTTIYGGGFRWVLAAASYVVGGAVLARQVSSLTALTAKVSFS